MCVYLVDIMDTTTRKRRGSLRRTLGFYPDEITELFKVLRDQGWSLQRIAREYSCHHTTVLYWLRRDA